MNGWKVFEKSKGGSKFDRYKNRMAVILTDAKNNYLYISQPVLEAMGKPEHIDIMTRGSNIGLTASENGGGYKVQRQKGGDTAYISVTKFCKSVHLQVGIYDVHMEAGGVAVFDSQGTPSKLS